MHIESLVKETVELQGFRVLSVTGSASGLVAMIALDKRFAPRCGQCLEPAPYRDTRSMRRIRHVPLWGIPVELQYGPRRVVCSRVRRDPYRVNASNVPIADITQQITGWEKQDKERTALSAVRVYCLVTQIPRGQ